MGVRELVAAPVVDEQFGDVGLVVGGSGVAPVVLELLCVEVVRVVVGTHLVGTVVSIVAGPVGSVVFGLGFAFGVVVSRRFALGVVLVPETARDPDDEDARGREEFPSSL